MRIRSCCLLVMLLVLAPLSRAVAEDDKALSPATACGPYAPDTLSSELQVSPAGIYVPGTTTEKIICTVLRDGDYDYVDGAGITIGVSYRVLGATPGRVTCTLYVGSTTAGADPVVTSTATGDAVSSGARAQVVVSASSQPNRGVYPLTLVCAVPPKTSVGAIVWIEYVPTETPAP